MNRERGFYLKILFHIKKLENERSVPTSKVVHQSNKNDKMCDPLFPENLINKTLWTRSNSIILIFKQKTNFFKFSSVV